MDGTVQLLIEGSLRPCKMRNRKYRLQDGSGHLMVYADHPKSGLIFNIKGELNGIWTAGDPEEV